MTNKIITLLMVMGLFVNFSYAQEEETGIMEMEMKNSGMTITDEMTVDADLNKQWRMGQSSYSAKPKNAWELGIHLGHFFIDGDVDRTLPGGWGAGLHLRKALHYNFSLRGDLFYGVATGLDPQHWRAGIPGAPDKNDISGGLIQNTYDPYDRSYLNPDAGHADGFWFPSHRTTQIYGALQGVLNLGNMLFHSKRTKWNWYMALGAGLGSHNTKLDLLDSNGEAYTDLLARVSWNQERFDTKEGRSDIKSIINTIYDGDYETDGPKKPGIFRLGDETNFHAMFTGSMGVARKITKRFNIGFEHQVMLQDNDHLDGITHRTAYDATNNADIEHYTNLRLGINLGSFDKMSEPLYWLNPMDATMSDIAALKTRPELDLSDEDGDGIVDMLDQELDTRAGCAVDTRGVTLDSDGDGLVDCDDKEPYSPPGYTVDKMGIADVPAECCITEDEVRKIVASNKPVAAPVTVVKSGCGEWFLPMIHYDLGKSYIKPEFYGQLHHVASVMKMCPELCIVAQGHTDNRNSNDYNNVLSYNRANAAVDYLVANYGIDRSRIKLMYGGETNSLIQGASNEGQHYMNRRVEFRVCGNGDFDMAKPAGAVNSGSVIRTPQYNGNKNSGY